MPTKVYEEILKEFSRQEEHYSASTKSLENKSILLFSLLSGLITFTLKSFQPTQDSSVAFSLKIVLVFWGINALFQIITLYKCQIIAGPDPFDFKNKYLNESIEHLYRDQIEFYGERVDMERQRNRRGSVRFMATYALTVLNLAFLYIFIVTR